MACNLKTKFYLQNAFQFYFQQYFTTRIENIYNQLGFEDRGDILQKMSRYEILKAACHLGNRDCIANSIKEYHLWKMEANPDINNP